MASSEFLIAYALDGGAEKWASELPTKGRILAGGSMMSATMVRSPWLALFTPCLRRAGAL